MRQDTTILHRILPALLVLGCAQQGDDPAKLVLEEEGTPPEELAAMGDDEDAPGPAPRGFVNAETEAEGVVVDASGTPTAYEPEVARVSQVPAAEMAARRSVRPAFAAKPPVDITTKTVDKLAQFAPDEIVRVLVDVDAPAFDFKRFRGKDENARLDLVEERKAATRSAQAAIEPDLEAYGATVVGRRWVSNHIVVEARAADVERLAEIHGVTALKLDDATQPAWWYDGADIRVNVLVDDLIDAGFDGMQGGRGTGGRVRIAVVESGGTNSTNWPADTHVGWLTWPNGQTRLRAIENCNANGCTAFNPTGAGNTHGSAVMWAAGGDIMDGQDPNQTTLDRRRRRSGASEEAWLYYYNDNGFCSGLESGIEEALTRDVDVLNMSLTIPAGQCDPDYDCMNDAIRNAFDAGTLVVAAAGNAGHDGACTLGYPALRSEVLAVGALNSDDVIDYGDMTLLDRENPLNSSSRGPVPITLANGSNRDTAGIDLVAPGVWRRNFTTANNYNLGTEWAGTSMAAPIVAGVAANMRDMFDAIGWNGPADAAAPLFISMLVLGDNWDFWSGADRRTAISDFSGYGRLRVHFPTGASLTGPWAWGWRAEHLNEGQTKSWSVGGSGVESNSVDEYKWAVAWFDEDLRDAADVIIQLWNTCPSGGGEVIVATDATYNTRKSIHLLQNEIGGRCLEMRATAYQTRPGGVVIYSTDYWHGGDPELH